MYNVLKSTGTQRLTVIYYARFFRNDC